MFQRPQGTANEPMQAVAMSIVIVNWNTHDLLIRCLDSLNTHVKASCEVFVVDNGSTDGSAAMVREKFPQVHLIANPDNRGFAAANNQALRQARGRYLVLLNTDALLFDDSLDKLITQLDEQTDIGMAGLQLLNEDGSKQNSIANIPSLLTELTNKSLLRKYWPARFPGKEHHFTEATDVESLIGACLVIRSQTAREVGLLDEDYFLWFEETEWTWRAAKHGWRIVFFPQFAIYHYQGKSAAKSPCRARIEYWRSRYIFFRKNYRTLENLILVTGLLTELLVELLLNATMGLWSPKHRGRRKIYWTILLWHLAGMPADWGLKPARPDDVDRAAASQHHTKTPITTSQH